MSERDLSTRRKVVFATVERGTECRVCGRDVEDGRATYCTDRCRDIADAVMRMLNWGGVKERVKERDGYTCQSCGIRAKLHRKVKRYVRLRVEELIEDLDPYKGEWDIQKSRRYSRARDELLDRYNYDSIPYVPLEVDHIERVADGGAIFDESNLQTLCESCHKEKTASENSKGGTHPEELETLTLDDYLQREGQDV